VKTGEQRLDPRLIWLGHATVLIEMNGLRLLTDPALGRRVGLLRRVAPPVDRRLAENIDAVLLSHQHADHLDLPSLRRLGNDMPIVGPPAVAAFLRRRGFTDLRAVGTGATTAIGPVTIEATPARHDGRRWPRGPAAEAVGFVVEGDASVYFAGDTDLFPEMSALAGSVQVALLPIAGWGPTLGPGHLDPRRAAEAAATIRPRLLIPIHWGTLAPPHRRPAPDALARPARELAEALATRAPGVDLRVLEPGGRTTLSAAPEPIR
jgi:L-ascorbate metabolism protein UlaG (beta-lactamase superfamily)